MNKVYIVMETDHREGQGIVRSVHSSKLSAFEFLYGMDSTLWCNFWIAEWDVHDEG